VAQRKAIAQINLGKPLRPHCPVFGTDGLLYVTTELAEAVTVIDPSTRKVVGAISTGQPESHMLVISHDGRRGYTANVGPGTVSVLDLKTRKLVKVIKISRSVQRISITPDDRYVFTADQASPRIAVIDTRTNQLHSWIAIPAVAFGTRVTLDGKWLLATLPGRDQIAVIDLKSMQFKKAFPVPKSPQEILLRPDGEVAFASCDSSHQVAEVDLHNWKVEKLIETGHNVDGMAWARRCDCVVERGPLSSSFAGEDRIAGQADQIGKQTVRSRHAFRQLPVEGEGAINVNPLAVPRHQ
jgi:YVTN family beta-propeller protein